VLLLVLFVGAAELAAWALLPPNLGRHEVDERIEQTLRPAQDVRVVLLSDSVSYGALDLVPSQAGVLDLSTNNAVSAAGNHFLIARLLERAPDLERVVYVASPVAWIGDLRGKLTSTYFTSVFTRPAEAEQVERLLGRSDLASAMRAAGRREWCLPPSYLRRGALARPLVETTRALGQDLREDRPVSSQPLPAALALYRERGAWRHFTASDTSRVFLERLGELCAERGVQLELLPSPLAPRLLESWRATGYWEEYLAWMRSLAGAHPTTTFVEECPWEAPSDGAFYDGDHLHAGPKKSWAEALAAYLGSG